MSSRSAVLCSRNAHKARELERLLPGLDDRAARPRRLPTRDRGDLLRQRADQGRLRSRARVRLGARGGLGPRGGRARRPSRRALGALRAGGSARRSRSSSASSRASRIARRATSPSSSCSRRTDASCAAPARSRGGSPNSAAGSEGFGYDPIFVPDGEERTVAELGNEWKAENSHRARAARALLEALAAA